MSRGHVNLTQAVPSLQPGPKPGTPSVQGLLLSSWELLPAPLILLLLSCLHTPLGTGGIFLLSQQVFIRRAPKTVSKPSCDLWIPILLLQPWRICSQLPGSLCFLHPNYSARTAQGDPKASACPKVTLNPEERIALIGVIHLGNNLSPEEVTACHSLLEPSSLTTDSRDGAAWCQGRQQGGLWAGCLSGCSLGVIWPPQSWAITDKTQTCPKAVLCLCPLGEPPALPAAGNSHHQRQGSDRTALVYSETQKT